MLSFEEFGIFWESKPNQSLHLAVTPGKINTVEVCEPFWSFQYVPQQDVMLQWQAWVDLCLCAFLLISFCCFFAIPRNFDSLNPSFQSFKMLIYFLQVISLLTISIFWEFSLLMCLLVCLFVYYMECWILEMSKSPHWSLWIILTALQTASFNCFYGKGCLKSLAGYLQKLLD